MSKRNWIWFYDAFAPSEIHVHGISKTYFVGETQYQVVEVVENPYYGKMLILDGDVQSSLLDEFIYHEALVHPALLAVKEPKKIMVLGGGEGATLRELYKHKSVEHVTMVDIDEEVVSICKEHLPEWHQGAFDDSRTHLVIADAGKVVRESEDKSYDVVISDLVEPFDMGPTYHLFTKEFFEHIHRVLADDGVFVLQASILRMGTMLMHAAIRKTLQQVFPVVRSFAAYVGSFDVPWSFVIATKGEDPKQWTIEHVNNMIKERISGELKFYDGESHVHMFMLPKYARTYFETEDIPILTDETKINLPSKLGMLPHD
ncbi:MAG: methyltransferase domain-containing protein [Dictyoglomi bacterium]|nr:methyltransferase domain-containing protein [Dictyoglomota bacterium]